MDGEFVARGYNIMKGYYKMPEATAAAIDEEGTPAILPAGMKMGTLRLPAASRI